MKRYEALRRVVPKMSQKVMNTSVIAIFRQSGQSTARCGAHHAAVISATLDDIKVRVFGHTAVVTGTDDEITMKDGKKSSNHYGWTDVFVKRNGRWLAVASQTA